MRTINKYAYIVRVKCELNFQMLYEVVHIATTVL